MTLGGLLDEASLPRCDLLKLDIEGGERRVLTAILPFAERIDAIVAELHDGLDYAWFAETVGRAGYISAPPGELFHSHPGAVRRGSAFEHLIVRS
jgi:hypothetical protein